jgi:hypothetical protein
MTTRTGALVEIVEPFTALNPAARVLPVAIKPYVVRVNGTDVGLLTKDGVQIDLGDTARAATVTLTLLASRVEIKAE